MLNFWNFLLLKKSLVSTFSEMVAITSRKYVSETGIKIPNLLGGFQFFWSHTSIFALELKVLLI